MFYPARWKEITVDQSKVLKNWLYRLFCFFWATRYKGLHVDLIHVVTGLCKVTGSVQKLSPSFNLFFTPCIWLSAFPLYGGGPLERPRSRLPAFISLSSASCAGTVNVITYYITCTSRQRKNALSSTFSCLALLFSSFWCNTRVLKK